MKVHKGVVEEEVDDHVGNPCTRNAEKTAGLELTHATYVVGDSTLTAKRRERFGEDLSLTQVVISPASIFESNRLVTVYDN